MPIAKPAPTAAPIPPKSRLAPVLVTLLVLAGGAAAAWWFLLRIPPGRLVVWKEAASALQIKVEGQTPGPDGSYRLPAGDYTVTAADDKGRVAESFRFKVDEGTLNVCVIGGVPVETAVTVKGRVLRPRTHFPTPGALRACAPCEQLMSAATCPKCAKPTGRVSPDAEVVFTPAQRFVDPAVDAPLLVVANPYSAAVKVGLRSAAGEFSFDLAAGHVRAVPCGAREKISAKTTLESDGSILDESELEAGDGVSLVAIGGSTWLHWVAEDGAPVSDGSVPPAPVQALKVEPGAVLVTPKAGDAALIAREAAGKPAGRLVALVSAPLASAPPRAPGRMTLHPQAKVFPLQLPKALDGKTLESAAPSGRGALGVLDGSIVDLSTGDPLAENGIRIRSAAVSSQGVVLLTRHGQCGTLDAKKFVGGSSVPDPTLRLWADPAGPDVYLFGGHVIRGLYHIGETGPSEILPDFPPVTALGASAEGTLIARGRRIDLLPRGAKADALKAVISLPDGPDVLGLHDAGRGLVFATEKGVYWLSDNASVPLVLGIGGPLMPSDEGIVVHDRASRRLFQLKGPFFKE